MFKKILTGLLLTAFSISAIADTPSFDYIDLGYSDWDFDGNASANGFELKGSKQVTDQLYIAGDYTNISQRGVSLDLSTIGLGYLYNFSNSSTLFVELDYANIKPNNGSNQDGYEFTLGVRSMLTSQFEIKGAIEFLDINGFDTTAVVLGAAYSFTDNFAAYLDYKVESDLNRLGVGVRFYF